MNSSCMNNNYYCDKHKMSYEIRVCPGGSWVYECPKCRSEGLYDSYATTHTEMKPVDEWTVSNKAERR